MADITKITVDNVTYNVKDETARAGIAGKYEKPSGGIPASDLASAVQTSLGKADTALQSYTETDPTVPSWAKASSKPTYTAQEVGALPSSTAIPSKTSDLTNDSGFLTAETDPTVPAWAKAQSKPSYTASEVGAIAAPSSPATGAFLVWNGSAWVAQTLSTWSGGNY